MVSDEKAQEQYQKAFNALNDIARSRRATPGQREEARKAMQNLTAKYVGKIIEDVEGSTSQFQNFITAMETVISQIGADSPIAALGTLKDLVNGSKKLVEPADSGKPTSNT